MFNAYFAVKVWVVEQISKGNETWESLDISERGIKWIEGLAGMEKVYNEAGEVSVGLDPAYFRNAEFTQVAGKGMRHSIHYVAGSNTSAI